MADGGPALGSGCIQHLLIAQARKTPRAPAVTFEDGAALSYSELDDRSTTLARVLRRLGVREEGLVGVRLPRCIGAVVGFVGILKAGGAYVAIDTCFPPDRQAHILHESGLQVLLIPRNTAARARTECGPDVALVELGPLGELSGEIWPQGAMGPEEAVAAEEDEEMGWHPGAPQDSRSRAYVLYTSGSTGKPKGVMVEHRGVVSLLHHFQQRLGGFGPGGTVLGLTTFCFDISVLELFLPLVTGARLCLASAATQRDPVAIVELVERERVTLLQATPATFEMLMLVGWTGHPSVHVVCGGEAYRLNLLPLAQSCASVTNGYGPTEATVYTTCYTLPADDPTRLRDVPIGTAVPGLRLYVLGEDLQPVAPGETGELFVAGAGVARGYLNQPDLTAERFLPDPFYEGQGQAEMMYKTGDACRWVADPSGSGEQVLAYQGRMDTQVKVNGFRIELGEIERVLQHHPRVGGAVVCCREDVPGRAKALVAYTMPAAGASAPTAADLRVHLARALPPYMVPDFYVTVAAFPLSPNGKVDRKALPPPPTIDAGSCVSTAATSCSTTACPALSEETTSVLSLSAPGESSDAASDSEGEEEEEGDLEDGSLGKGRARGGSSTTASALRLVARLVREQSGVEVDAASSMSAIGLDSLGMVAILAKLSNALGGMRVPPAAIFEYETVGGFAAYLARRVAAERPHLLPEPKSGATAGSSLSSSSSSPVKPRKLRGALRPSGLSLMAGDGQQGVGGATAAASSYTAGSVAALAASLTGLRGVLILWVVAEHFVDRGSREPFGFRFSANTFLFVLLSGFTAALQAAGSAPGKWRWRPFLASKALGLFPIYYLAIVMSLPRYIAVTSDPVAYSGPGWRRHGFFRTDYQHGPWTYLVDAAFLLTGMQTWVEEVNHRSINTLYYTSVQWNLYLFFALLLGLWHRLAPRHPGLLPACEHAVGGPLVLWPLVAAAALGALALACARHPAFLKAYSPWLYLPAFVAGMAAARVYICCRPWVVRFAEALLAATPAEPAAPPRAPPTPVGDADRNRHQHFSYSSSSSSSSSSDSGRHLGRPLFSRATTGWLWARAGDALAASILLVALGPFGSEGPLDQALCLMGLPLLTAAFVVVTALQGPQHASWTKRWVLGSQWAGILGALSYAIYLTHEAIGDVYLQMAVKDLYRKWHGLLPPPGTPWWDKYVLYVTPWMSTQPAVLKLAALALSIVFGWLLQTYVVDIGVLALLDAGGRAWRGLCGASKKPHRRHDRIRSGQPTAATTAAAVGGAAVDRGGWARLRVPGRPGMGSGASQLGIGSRQGGAAVEATVLAV